ncbi:hypothetical protein B4135_0346 [Caldibacillus debilis]|uniref:Uncharacterized protein n=1 Tax=Caldibacillus debilis TaxID=301148 RepID=A0A150M5F5_9BACI|nr:hypothetical protein B4135_0346 [Caldibacillus debilis]
MGPAGPDGLALPRGEDAPHRPGKTRYYQDSPDGRKFPCPSITSK